MTIQNRQSLNRYAATPLGQPGVAEGGGSPWSPFDDPVVSNLGKGVLSISLSEATVQGSLAYLRASAYSIPGRAIWGERTLLTTASPSIDRALLGLGMAGLAAREVMGAPPGSLRARMFGAGKALLERAAVWNSEEIALKVIIGYEFRYGHRLPLGRTVGGLGMLLKFNKLTGHIFNVGLGLGIDVGYQAWMDYDNPYLSSIQFRRRLLVTGAGSLLSFGAGLGATSLAEVFGASTIGVLGGPAVWFGLSVGLIVAVSWDSLIAPEIYEGFGLEPKRNLAPLP